MLILTRKKGQSFIIKIGEKKAKVFVSEVRGQQVKIGIEAQKEVSIRRTELKKEGK